MYSRPKKKKKNKIYNKQLKVMSLQDTHRLYISSTVIIFIIKATYYLSIYKCYIILYTDPN